MKQAIAHYCWMVVLNWPALLPLAVPAPYRRNLFRHWAICRPLNLSEIRSCCERTNVGLCPYYQCQFCRAAGDADAAGGLGGELGGDCAAGTLAERQPRSVAGF